MFDDVTKLSLQFNIPSRFDASALLELRSCPSCCQNFTDGVNYAFLKLGMSHLQLKDHMKQVILATWFTISLIVDKVRTLKRKGGHSWSFPLNPLLKREKYR